MPISEIDDAKKKFLETMKQADECRSLTNFNLCYLIQKFLLNFEEVLNFKLMENFERTYQFYIYITALFR